jgi:hypothetical protein
MYDLVMYFRKSSLRARLEENVRAAEKGKLSEQTMAKLSQLEFEQFGVSWDPSTIE